MAGTIEVDPVQTEDRTEDLKADLAIRPEFVGIENLEVMQRRQEVLEILLKNALKKTSARHWLSYGDTKQGTPTDPRPEDEAAVAIARDLGISWVWVPMGDGPNDWAERQKKNGEQEIFVTIRGHCFGQIIEEIGSSATDDPLLKHSKRAETRGQTALFSDVLKKARANAIVRLVQAFGVRAVTWEDLATAGIKREACDKVEFAESEDSAAKGAARGAAGKPCPKCGKPMRLRDRKDGSGQFLGCTGYPNCRHIENLAEAAPEAHQAAPDPAKAVPPDDTPTPAEVAAPAGAETPQNGDPEEPWAEETDKPEADASPPTPPPVRTGPDAAVEENKRLGEQATKYVAGLSASEVKVKVFDYARTRFPKDKTTGMAFVSAVLGKTWETFHGMTTEDLRKVLVAFEVSQE